MSKVITLSFCHLQVTERERVWGGDDTQTQRHETVIFEVHLQSTGFSSSQSLWAISSCNNPHLSLLVLSEWPNIEPQDLSACLPASLPAFLVIHLWRINYCVPNFEYILQLSDEVKKKKTQKKTNPPERQE